MSRVGVGIGVVGGSMWVVRVILVGDSMWESSGQSACYGRLSHITWATLFLRFCPPW